VTVFGDVNPGGQIIASGNVVVLGALKGQVHAGSDGDDKAFVMALDLRPTQIRIGSHLCWSAPQRPGAPAGGPEMATVKGDEIVVEPYRPSRSENGSHAAKSRRPGPARSR